MEHRSLMSLSKQMFTFVTKEDLCISGMSSGLWHWVRSSHKICVGQAQLVYSSNVFNAFGSQWECRCRILAVGPRLSSFLMDLSDSGDIISDDTRRILPVPSNTTLQLCAYMFHDAAPALAHFPLNTVLAEYGFQVRVWLLDFTNWQATSSRPFPLLWFMN